MFSPTQKPRISADLIWSQLDDDAVIVSAEAGHVRVLNGVGTAIWKLLVDERPIGEIADFLVSHYQVSPEQAQTDLAHFLAELIDRDLITLAG